MTAGSTNTMSTLTTAPDQTRSAFARAFDRAKAAGLVAYKTGSASYAVPSSSQAGVEYDVTFVGPEWFRWTCSCQAANHVACLHRATAIYAKKNGIAAVRPQTSAERDAVAAAEALVACTGYLHLHAPAVGSNLETYCCTECEPFL